MYDPVLARFVSADSVVPGDASGSLDGIALKPLTVDFHEVGFGATLNGENGQPFWFQMSDQQRQKAGSPWGPANPQALNRYSYVQGNPVRFVDPNGHMPILPCRSAAECTPYAIYHKIQKAFQDFVQGLLDIGSPIGVAANLVPQFRGPAAKGFDWDHIMKNHSENGTVAQQRLRSSGGRYDGIFQNMDENQIKASIQEAWKNRARMETQLDPVSGIERIRYRGIDSQSKLVIDMWYNKATGIVETAFPIR